MSEHSVPPPSHGPPIKTTSTTAPAIDPDQHSAPSLDVRRRRVLSGWAVLVLGALYALMLGRHTLAGGPTAAGMNGPAEHLGRAVGLLAAGFAFRRGLKVVRQDGAEGVFGPVSARRQAISSNLAVGLSCVLVALVALFAVFGTSSGSAADAWNSQAGVSEKAGFIDGCTQAGGPPARCACVFEHLVQAPQYDTPIEFLSVSNDLARAAQTRNPADVPPAIRALAAPCQ